MIKYSAKDSVKINKQKNEIFLYNEAVLEYQDMTLNSGVILLNYLDNQVYAGRIPSPDSVGILVQKPVFTQGRDEINPDSIYGISKYVGEMFIKQIYGLLYQNIHY